MKRTRTIVLAGLALLASCGPDKTPESAAMNGVKDADEIQSDADARAERLAEQAQILNTEARMAIGAHRKQLAGEAAQDEKDAIAIVRDADNRMSAVDDATESQVRALENGTAR